MVHPTTQDLDLALTSIGIQAQHKYLESKLTSTFEREHIVSDFLGLGCLIQSRTHGYRPYGQAYNYHSAKCIWIKLTSNDLLYILTD